VVFTCFIGIFGQKLKGRSLSKVKLPSGRTKLNSVNAGEVTSSDSYWRAEKCFLEML